MDYASLIEIELIGMSDCLQPGSSVGFCHYCFVMGLLSFNLVLHKRKGQKSQKPGSFITQAHT